MGGSVQNDRLNLMQSDPSVLTVQPKLTSKSKGKVDVFNLTAARELPYLVTFDLFFTSFKMAHASWMLFVIFHAVFTTDRLKTIVYAAA